MKNNQLLKQFSSIIGKGYDVKGNIEFTKKIGDYDSFGNVSDDYKSLQDILKVLNDNIEEF